MAFIPEDDFVYRGRKSCGIEGSRAVREIRASIRHTAITGQELKPVPQYLTRPDRHLNYSQAEIFENSKSWLGRIADKPTWDLPAGGKHMSVASKKVQPSPIITPEHVTSISGSVRRMGAVDIPPEKLRMIWSEGRDNAIRDFAVKMSQTPSPIPYQNPPSRLSPLKCGTRPIQGRSNVFADSRPPDLNCIPGFRGVGNFIEIPAKRRNLPPGNAVPYEQLAFTGERKPIYSCDPR